MEKTVVLGASPNPGRFSHQMVTSLVKNGREVVPLGQRKGTIAGRRILTGKPQIEDVHTICMYIGPRHQPPMYDYIFSLKPSRIIFNPGTFNPELAGLAREKGIETVAKCALIMMAQGTY
jgi:predicted CoA-binding protein